MTERKRVTKPIHAFEQLDDIEAEKDGAKKAMLLQKYGSTSPLNFILSLNFNSTVKLDLPEGMPELPIKDMNQLTHPDMIGLLSANIHRLRYCVPTSDLKKFKKESLFIDVLINCPMKDAEIICSAKDKALTELYPTITAELVGTVFPGYVK